MADLPVLSSVVMASVAMERLESEMSDSRSTLQVVTDSGWLIATLFSVRTAANLQRRDTQRHASSTAIPPPNTRQAVELARRKNETRSGPQTYRSVGLLLERNICRTVMA